MRTLVYTVLHVHFLNSVELKNWFRILSAVAVMMKVVTVILYIIQGAYTAENGKFLSLNYLTMYAYTCIWCIHVHVTS